ncbi:MAG TPA: hypothetical protein VJI98_01020 [Candidatus Nanoarchaeia archaeon]|nr:hypothetical protein [Candidatus Nanoarchaeia archaeon]
MVALIFKSNLLLIDYGVEIGSKCFDFDLLVFNPDRYNLEITNHNLPE